MIPEKEHLKVLENIAKHETAIYSDSADTGTYITDADLAQIRQSVKALKAFYGGRNWTCNGSTMRQAAVLGIHIPYEVEGDMARGVIVDVNVVQSVRKEQFATSPKRYVTIRFDPFHKQTKDVPVLLQDEMDQT